MKRRIKVMAAMLATAAPSQAMQQADAAAGASTTVNDMSYIYPWIAAWYTIPPVPYGEKVSWICKECAKEYTLTVKQTFDNVELDKITKLHDESSELIASRGENRWEGSGKKEATRPARRARSALFGVAGFLIKGEPRKTKRRRV